MKTAKLLDILMGKEIVRVDQVLAHGVYVTIMERHNCNGIFKLMSTGTRNVFISNEDLQSYDFGCRDWLRNKK